MNRNNGKDAWHPPIVPGFTRTSASPVIQKNLIPGKSTVKHWFEGIMSRSLSLNFDYHGRMIPYDVQVKQPVREVNAANYFRQNPHRLHLGIIGLELKTADGKIVTPTEITNLHQELNLWEGVIRSSFTVNGEEVNVVTCCSQEKDLISAEITSPLIGNGLLSVKSFLVLTLYCKAAYRGERNSGKAAVQLTFREAAIRARRSWNEGLSYPNTSPKFNAQEVIHHTATLNRYAELVNETADFMSSFAFYDKKKQTGIYLVHR